jgi:transposase
MSLYFVLRVTFKFIFSSKRSGAFKGLVEECLSMFNYKKKCTGFHLSNYKTKKKEKTNGWCISMEKINVVVKEQKSLFIYGKMLGEMRYCSNKQLRKLIPKEHPDQDCKLQRDAFGDYYLIVTHTTSRPKTLDTIAKVTSVDPGVRKFATTYDNDNVVIYGNRWGTQITKLSLHADNLYSRRAKANGKKKWVLQQRINRIRKQIYNYKKEMRHQVANSIVNSSDLVLMPKLETKDMVIKCKRRLKTKTVKQLLAACHGMFFDHLRFKCRERGKRFLRVSEHYTSKTCPSCGLLKKCDEVFKCTSCNFSHDRDAVGALNILLRAVR